MLHSYVRYGVSVVLGAIVAVILLYIMQAVISTDKNPLNEAPKIRIMEFVRVIEDTPPPIKPPNFDEPPPPDEMPPDMPEIEMSDDSMGSDIVDLGQHDFDFNVGDWGSGWSQDGEYLPLNYVIPEYPTRALQRGIEGYVTLKYTVTAEGTVENPVIIEEKPPGVFGRSAIRAALKFKYRPKVVNGRAVAVHGVQNRITFELEEM